MNTPPSARGFPPHPSLMPELDSLSDSDWLDIASGRDSDDNDSFSEQDSDRDEISSLPRSRRSSISNDESMSSDVEAWEGFVSDSGEAVVGMYPMPPTSPFGAEPIALGSIPDNAIVADPALSDEERRVKGLLDQSFVGTLSSSRSSAHTSIRDLRLSFPDPLTSSRNDLNRSYETVSTSTGTGTALETSAKDVLPVDADPVAHVVESPLLEDPGLITTPAVLRQESQTTIDNEDALEIVLYGTSSEIKWLFLQQFVEKAAMTSGHNLCDNFRGTGENQTISLSSPTNGITPFFNTIHVIDRTLNESSKVETDNDSPERPSLAIIYLPTSQLPNLSWHSCYLPVLIPTGDVDRESVIQTAEDDWDLLGVPSARTLRLGHGKSTILDADAILSLESTRLYEALRNIGRDNKKVTYLKPISEQVKSVNAVTFFALVSIIVGFAFNSSFRPSTPTPTPTVNISTTTSGHIWNLLTPNNRSIVANQPSRIGSTLSSISPSSLKDVSLSVFDAGSTSLAVTSPPSAKSLSISNTSNDVAKMTTTSPSAHCRNCENVASSSRDKPSASTDVIAMPTSQTPSIYVGSSGSVMSYTGSPSTILLTGTDRASAISKSIVAPVASAAAGINFNSVTEALDATTKALAEAVTKDLSELAEVADELLGSIREQTDSVIRQSKGKARAFGEQIQNLNEELVYRNERAKRRARELKRRGEAMVRGATSELKRRTTRARKRAKALKKSVVDGGTEAWRTFERAQADWEAALVTMPQDGKENANAYDCRKEAVGDVKVNRASATLCA